MKRLNLSITERTDKRLDLLLNNNSLDVASKAEVIRISLSLLDYLLEQKGKGNNLSITKDGKIVKDIFIHT